MVSNAVNTVVTDAGEALSFDNISLAFAGRQVFDGLSLSLQQARWTVVLGRSGCGKTSLLKLAAGIIIAEQGQVIRNDTFSQVAYMAQDDCLMPWLSLLENVRLGARLRSGLDRHSAEQALACLESVGLVDRAKDSPAMLSGGQRQRVALARTLFENRQLILMDEPFSRLDAITRHELQTLAAEKFRGRTVLLVTHDPLEALRLAHTILIMKSQHPQITSYEQSPFDEDSDTDAQQTAVLPRDLTALDLPFHQNQLWGLLQ